MKTITLPFELITELFELLDDAKSEISDGQDYMETLVEYDFDGSLQERMDSKDETIDKIKDYKSRLKSLIK